MNINHKKLNLFEDIRNFGLFSDKKEGYIYSDEENKLNENDINYKNDNDEEDDHFYFKANAHKSYFNKNSTKRKTTTKKINPNKIPKKIV